MMNARARLAPLVVMLAATGLAPSLAPSLARAAPVTYPLVPAHSQVKLTGYGAGFIPNSGEFHDYKGTLTIDPDDINVCKVDLTLQVKSLNMGMVTDMVLAKDFLDPDTYPTTVFKGACKAGPDGKPILAGELTMHGQTHPFDLNVSFDDHVLTNSGTLKRTEWGVTGRQGVIGNSTKVTVVIRLPDTVAFKNAAATD